MLNNYEMSSVCVDTGVMWRLSEDFNRRFAARVHQQSHHMHTHHHRPASMAMIYNGKTNELATFFRSHKFIYLKLNIFSNFENK